MLSQKVTKLCVQIAYSSDSIKKQNLIIELDSTLNLFERSHYKLFNSNKKFGLYTTNSNITQDLYLDLKTHFEIIISSAKEIIHNPESNTYVLDTISENEKEFLFLMNKIVFQYDTENGQKMKGIKLFMIILILFTVIILFLELKFVLLPIIKKENENSIRIIQSNKTKDKFFSIIAHDLKSPVSTMLGFTEELNNNFDRSEKEEQKEFIGIIYKSVKNTSNLLENLLLWASAQKGNIGFNREELNLNLIASESMELMSHSAKKKDIQVIIQIPNEIFVHADKNMLSTIIRNLLSNAIKFTPKGGEINIIAQQKWTIKTEQFVEIIVKDNGIGIPKEMQSKLFEISENKSTYGTEKEKGSGLGLILCKEFVEKHNGKIWIESDGCKGSSVIFTIPLFS